MTDAKKPPVVTATWDISLDCDCPGCGEYVNLLDGPDFWDGRHLDICEHGTERSRGVRASCPECGFQFTVDCEH